MSNLFNGEVIPTTFYFYLWCAFSFATRDCFGSPDLHFFRVKRWTAKSAVAVAVAAFFTWHGVRSWQADRALTQALAAVGAGEYRRLISAAEAGAAASGEAGTYHLAACEMMLAFAERNPGLPENDYRQLLNLGIAYGLEGLRTDRPMVAYHCISKLGEYSKDPRTESWLRELVSVDPHWFRGYLLLADHALNAGRLDEAKAHAQTASRLAPFHQEPSLLWDRIQSADGR